MPSDIEIVESFYSAMASRDLGAMFALLEESFAVTQDERLRWGGRREDHDGFASFDLPEVHRWTIGAGGRALRAHVSIDTPAMLAALSG